MDKKFVVYNEKKKQGVCGTFFSISKVEMGLYDEKTADLILNLMKMRGMKGFAKYEWLGEK